MSKNRIFGFYNKSNKGGITKEYEKESFKATTYLKECHKGTIPVFFADGIQFYGGGTSRSMTIWSDLIIVDCADRFDPLLQIYGIKLPKIDKHMAGNPLIKIDWTDYRAPSINVAFWKDLYCSFQELAKKKEIVEVVCCCMGGHGRTGTALSIFAGLSGLVPDGKCPVEFVRDNYCKNAVESEEQLKYIEKATGLKVTASPAKEYLGYSSYHLLS